MPICFVLGGFLESTLSRDPQQQQIVWVDVNTLILGKFGVLRLAPDGESPGPPDGVQLYATGALGPYVTVPATLLALQLIPQGYQTRVTWYDWRKTHYQAGVALAARIRAAVTTADPCTIVGHSAGGIVARAAWTELGSTGEHNLVRRIVTLGTPHQGSYEPCITWAGQSQSLQMILQLNQQVGSLAWGAAGLVGYQSWTLDQLRQLTMTWPALYELLPLLDVPAAVSDPNRVGIYTASNWPVGLRPQQAWLDYSRYQTGPWLRSQESMPPSQVLTCVSGYFSATYSRLGAVNSLGTVDHIESAEPGDGIVTRSSAELVTGAAVRVTGAHSDLMLQLVNSGELRDMILETRAPSPEPPPPEVIPGIVPPQLAGPPLAQAIAPYGWKAGCGVNKCGC